MTAKLLHPVSQNYAQAAVGKTFFSIEEAGKIEKQFESREQPILGVPSESCKTNLFFGFFFDGTKNNYLDAETGKNHSNVARLYDCYPGLSTPGVLPAAMDWKHKPERYSHFFKTYIPGVSSRFDLVSDDGKSMAGGAAGAGGEARIIWALLQVINNIHRYFLKTPLLNAEDAARLITRISLGKFTRLAMERKTPKKKPDDRRIEDTRKEFEVLLRKLHKAIAAHMHVNLDGRVKKADPAVVKKIYVSIFGFSRGATQARAFTNWMRSLCSVDSELCGSRTEHTLAGFPVQFDFLGLFDTVASVGFGNTMGNTPLLNLFDGHSAWADAEDSLRIPAGIRCVHLVAAHELRRSFPVDSISVKQVLPENCEEVIVPGVHSDLGSGYAPCEQGKGIDPSGADMLARIPLVYMYRAARLSGFPLKLELASDTAKQRFRIEPKTIQVLNDYLATCKEKSGTITTIMREQARKQMEWRVARRASGNTPLHLTEFFKRASNFDKNDLHSANLEFESEIAEFEAWLAKKGKDVSPTPQPPGFDNSHEDEWEEIATWWNRAPGPAAAVMAMFDDYVHDSHAWFKLVPGNPDNEYDMHELLQKWVDRRQKVKKYNEQIAKQNAANQGLMLMNGRRIKGVTQTYQPIPEHLSPAQIAAADEYSKMDQDRKSIPRMITWGREPYGLRNKAGYLRFRKVYGGWDSILLSSVQPDQNDAESSVTNPVSQLG